MEQPLSKWLLGVSLDNDDSEHYLSVTFLLG